MLILVMEGRSGIKCIFGFVEVRRFSDGHFKGEVAFEDYYFE